MIGYMYPTTVILLENLCGTEQEKSLKIRRPTLKETFLLTLVGGGSGNRTELNLWMCLGDDLKICVLCFSGIV